MHNKGQCKQVPATSAATSLWAEDDVTSSHTQILGQDQELLGICRDLAPDSCIAEARTLEADFCSSFQVNIFSHSSTDPCGFEKSNLKNNPTVNRLQTAVQEFELPWGNRDFSKPAIRILI